MQLPGQLGVTQRRAEWSLRISGMMGGLVGSMGWCASKRIARSIFRHVPLCEGQWVELVKDGAVVKRRVRAAVTQ